jgi:DNA-binding phage protein
LKKWQEGRKTHISFYCIIGAALLQALIDNDVETYMEILDSYLRVNRSIIAERSDLSRSTVSLALSKKSNPTLKTIAKIVHEAYRVKANR